MSHVNKSRGFTLIELVLAMGFVAVLLLAIAMTVIQIGNIYNKGLTLKEVNQAGRSLTTELQRSIAQSLPFDVRLNGPRYIKSDWGGRLCVGQYSYIWNYGSAIDPNNLDVRRNQYFNLLAGDIRFVKVVDQNSNYCTAPSQPIDSTQAVELLNVGEHTLAIHDFTITNNDLTSDSKTGQRLYNISFKVGTNDQSTLTAEKACKTLNEDGANPAYCSVNQFNIVVLAGNSFK